MVCFLLFTYEVVFPLSTLRTVRDFHVHVSVRITPGHNKNRHKTSRPVPSCTTIYAVHALSAARFTDILRGSYLLSEQSPASSQTAPFARSIIIHDCSANVNCFFQRKSSIKSTKRPKPSPLLWTLRRPRPTGKIPGGAAEGRNLGWLTGGRRPGRFPPPVWHC